MSHSPFDTSHVAAQWGDPGDETYRATLQIFQEECGALCQDAHAALSDARRDAILRAAHTLQGAAANVGAMGLAGCAQAVAEAAPSAPFPQLAELIGEMEDAVCVVQAAIAAGEPAAHGG